MVSRGKSRKRKKPVQQSATFDRKRRSRFVLAILGVSLIVVITFVMSRPRQNSNTEPMDSNTDRSSSDITLPGNVDFQKEGELTFLTSGGIEISTIDIEIAETRLETAQGMMYRTRLEPDQGMLFVFPFERPQSFWMKNTQIPLDIIFINSNMQIVTIHRDAAPFDESSYPSSEPAKFVVEVNSGYTKEHGINVGDKIKWSETLE